MKRRIIPIPLFLMSLILLFLTPLLFLTNFIFVIKILTLISITFVFLSLVDGEFGFLGIGMMVILDSFTRVFLATGGSFIFRWNINNYVLLVITVFHLARGIKIKDPHSKWLFLLLLLMLVQLSYSKNFNSGSYTVLNMLSFFGFLVVIISNPSKSKIYNKGDFLTIAIFALIIHFMYRMMSGLLPYIDHGSVAQSGISGLLALCLGLSLDNNSRYSPMPVAFLSSLIFALIFLTGSRSITLISLLLLMYIVIKLGKFSLTNRIFSIIMISMTFILFLGSQFTSAFDTAQSGFEKLFNVDSSLTARTNGRSDLLKTGWLIFINNPMGIGTGSLDKSIIRFYTDNPILDNYGLTSVHSALMKTLAENGALGGILLIFFVLSFAFDYIKREDKITAEIGLLCSAILFLSLFFTEFQGKSLLFFAAGSAYILHYYTGIGLQRGIDGKSKS